ncbi:MAG: MFS transporter [Cyanobacteria bacterium]|nr:MFS transporter [Cyanobacteriota bacterium]
MNNHINNIDIRADEVRDNAKITSREILSWAMFDVANSSYVTVVNTAIFNAYFVGVVAGSLGAGKATFLLTVCIAISNALIVLTAPIVGTIADFSASKKKLLFFSSVSLVIGTLLLVTIGPGEVALAVCVLALSNFMYGTGENLIAAFLPEIASQENMGRVSAFGWTLGYFGGLVTLGLCLAYVAWAEGQGQKSSDYVPITMLIVAAIFSIASTPTFLVLKERAKAIQLPDGKNYFQVGFDRLKETIGRASHYRDLFVFLLALMSFTAGSTTVAIMAAVFAKEVMGFKTSDTILMLMMSQVAGSAGAYSFGALQDKLGSVKTVALSLVVWIIAVGTVLLAQDRTVFWCAAVLMGAAMGASQSAGRALVGQFSPPERSAEFFGLWGLAVKLAAIIGPIVYGGLTYLTGGNYRLGLVSTILFFG